MKIINVLFNFKKAAHDNKVLGVERCFIDYTKYLSGLGNEVVSIVKEGTSYCDEVRQYGKETVEINASSVVDVSSMFKMAKLFFTFKPDVIICHSKRALFFSRIARFLSRRKVPIIAINHGIKVEKFMKADYVFAVNTYFTKVLIERGMPADRAIAVPNMAEVEPGFVSIQKPAFRTPIQLGSLGRISPEKYFDKAIRAVKILKDRGIECEYSIGGIGAQEAELRKLAKDLNVEKNVKILGWTTDKKKFFEDIDIFLLPSWGETFGIVLLEAMIYNTPIITSNSWGPEEIIDNEVDGIKVSKDDAEKMPELLADAILKLVNDQEFARKLAVNAHKKFFNEYEASVVTKKLNKLLKEIVEKNRK